MVRFWPIRRRRFSSVESSTVEHPDWVYIGAPFSPGDCTEKISDAPDAILPVHENLVRQAGDLHYEAGYTAVCVWSPTRYRRTLRTPFFQLKPEKYFLYRNVLSLSTTSSET